MQQRVENIPCTVRAAELGDVSAISSIYNHFVLSSTATFATEPETLAQRSKWFEAHLENKLPVLVACESDRVIGWASLSYYHERTAYKQTVEISFYIDKECVGRGIGKQLTDAILNIAKTNGYHCVVSLVCSENDASIALLKKFDFKLVGVLNQVGRKFDRWLDVTIMQKML